MRRGRNLHLPCVASQAFGPYAPPEGFQAGRDGLEILRRQREAHPEDVGGFAQLTTLRRGEISTRILERRPV